MKAHVPASAISLTLIFAFAGIRVGLDEGGITHWIGALIPAAITGCIAYRITREDFNPT